MSEDSIETGISSPELFSILKDPNRRPAAEDACLQLKYGAEFRLQSARLINAKKSGSIEGEVDASARLTTASTELGIVNERIDHLSLKQNSPYAKDVHTAQKALETATQSPSLGKDRLLHERMAFVAQQLENKLLLHL